MIKQNIELLEHLLKVAKQRYNGDLWKFFRVALDGLQESEDPLVKENKDLLEFIGREGLAGRAIQEELIKPLEAVAWSNTSKDEVKPVMDWVKSVDDAIGLLGREDPEVRSLYGLIVTKQADHLVNYQRAIVVAKALNEGWVPDWNNSDEYKYFPWFYMGGSAGFRFVGYDSWASASGVGSRLCFKTSELAEYAGKQFEEVYKGFMV